VIQSLRMRCRRSRSSSSTMGGGPPAASRPASPVSRVSRSYRLPMAPPVSRPTSARTLARRSFAWKRLADEVGPPDLHGRDAVAHVGTAGDEEDGHLARLRLAAQDLAQLPPVEAGACSRRAARARAARPGPGAGPPPRRPGRRRRSPRPARAPDTAERTAASSSTSITRGRIMWPSPTLPAAGLALRTRGPLRSTARCCRPSPPPARVTGSGRVRALPPAVPGPHVPRYDMSNARSRSSALMPTPVSLTTTCACTGSAQSRRRTMPPAGVYWSALSSTLRNTRCRATGPRAPRPSPAPPTSRCGPSGRASRGTGWRARPGPARGPPCPREREPPVAGAGRVHELRHEVDLGGEVAEVLVDRRLAPPRALRDEVRVDLDDADGRAQVVEDLRAQVPLVGRGGRRRVAHDGRDGRRWGRRGRRRGPAGARKPAPAPAPSAAGASRRNGRARPAPARPARPGARARARRRRRAGP
jgi:hypothetical protein